ncbi:MAG: anaerobic ribonucleoside-triphosphate reductase activating protein [Firmicutes bacterium]|nr:anaerobic ribonucleoside-triphosphate reductase activating protein [Bacillota bacterium]
MNGTKIRIAGTIKESITDGAGIRYTVFVQGCAFACEGCHNSHAQNFDGGTLADINEIFADIIKNPLLSGVTFSGGEPFLQAEGLSVLAEKIKEAGLELAVYTGYSYEEIINSSNPHFSKLLSFTDTLIDGRFILSQKSLKLKFKGSGNQRIINVKESLRQDRVILDESERWN